MSGLFLDSRLLLACLSIVGCAVVSGEGFGGVMTSSSGEISSPNFPNRYSANTLREYTIRTEPNTIIRLTFRDFGLEAKTNGSCSYDYLEIYDGDSINARKFGRFCGSFIPPEIRSSQNSLYLRFKTDGSLQYRGFNATYSTCCGRVMTSSSGEIFSPNYPNNNLANTLREYNIRTEPNTIIRLTFRDFGLEAKTNGSCSYDYLEIYDGDSINARKFGRFCGSFIPPEIRSSQNSLYLRFETDGSNEYSGFHATYSTSCGRVMTSSSGEIKSPNFPNNYPANSECEYTIRTEPETIIRLTFRDFGLEPGTSCVNDYLEIYDGDSINAMKLGRFCGSSIPPEIRSSQNSLYLRFKTDRINQYSGFRATYSTSCGRVMTSSSGEIKSPNFPNNYPANSECEYTIRTEPNTIIRLTFRDFGLEPGTSCVNDYLEIYDGDSINARKLGRFCGSSIPPEIRSSQNSLYLRFETDGSDQYSGFRATYSTSCGRVMTSSSGEIKSPNFPYNYPASECEYTIRTEPNTIIRLTFRDVGLEPGTPCVNDYLEIYDGDSINARKLGRFCGSSIPPEIRSSQNSLYLRFETDGSDQYSGFRATYSTNIEMFSMTTATMFLAGIIFVAVVIFLVYRNVAKGKK